MSAHPFSYTRLSPLPESILEARIFDAEIQTACSAYDYMGDFFFQSLPRASAVNYIRVFSIPQNASLSLRPKEGKPREIPPKYIDQ